MREPIHLLTDPTCGIQHVTVVCRATMPERGTWDVRAVTCTACLAPAQTHTSVSSGLSEKTWLQQVRTYARQHGWLTYHSLNSQGSEPGWVDLVLLKPPVLHLAELKIQGGKLTPAQQRWLEGLQAVEHVSTHLWYPEDLPTILAVLRS